MASERTYFIYPTPMGRITLASDGRSLTRLAYGAVELSGTKAPTALTNEAANHGTPVRLCNVCTESQEA